MIKRAGLIFACILAFLMNAHGVISNAVADDSEYVLYTNEGDSAIRKLSIVNTDAIYIEKSTINIIADKSTVRLPGAISNIPSPDGRYSIYASDKDIEPHHQLFISKPNEAAMINVLVYDRHLDVSISPDGKRFFVNDHAGSDFTASYLYRASDVSTRTSLEDEMRNSITQKSIWGNHHVYVEAVRWLGNCSLLMHVHGYGDNNPQGFSIISRYKIEDCR